MSFTPSVSEKLRGKRTKPHPHEQLLCKAISKHAFPRVARVRRHVIRTQQDAPDIVRVTRQRSKGTRAPDDGICDGLSTQNLRPSIYPIIDLEILKNKQPQKNKL
jgi:hypothetical protein